MPGPGTRIAMSPGSIRRPNGSEASAPTSKPPAKIGPGVYQFTAVDDCTSYKVVAIFSRVSAKNPLLFLEKLIEEMPFPVQRIQTDRGEGFFAYLVQEKLMELSIKFRPTKPRSPHLKWKVERAQKTDLDEFYSTVNIKQPDLADRFQEWQHYYNWDRVHESIGKPPSISSTSTSKKYPSGRMWLSCTIRSKNTFKSRITKSRKLSEN